MDITQGAILLVVIGLVILAAFAFSRTSYESDDHPILNQVRSNFSKINPEYANIPLRKGNSAYTENKAVITICLKNPETDEYYDMNTIMYVALHELAHIVSKSHGHTDEFKNNFTDLLRKGAKLGIYNPRKAIPETYCGIS